MAKCANCGWDWFDHKRRNACPIQWKPKTPHEKRPRFTPIKKGKPHA